jgi:drug/metabolite transporter (DMT)-like permease
MSEYAHNKNRWYRSSLPYLLTGVAPLCWGGNIVLARGVADIIPPVSFAFWRWTIAFIILFLLPLYVWELSGSQTITLTRDVVLSILYVALFPSIVAYFCWNRGVEVIGANRAGLFINLIPVFASVLAILFLGETLQGFHIIGMALIFGGMILFNR